MALEDWTDILYIQMHGCAGYGSAAHPELCAESAATPLLAVIFFVSFVLLGTIIMLNLFMGVIENGMHQARREMHDRRRVGQWRPPRLGPAPPGAPRIAPGRGT